MRTTNGPVQGESPKGEGICTCFCVPVGAKGAFLLILTGGLRSFLAPSSSPRKNRSGTQDDRKDFLQPTEGNADITDMTDPQRRALRTLLQAAVGAIGAGLINLLAPKGISPEWLAVIGVVLTTLFTQIQNSLEDAGTIPALLKAPASSGENPIPDPEG